MKNYVIGVVLGFFVGFSLRGLLEKPPVVHSQGGQGGSAYVHGSGFAKGGDGGNTNCSGDLKDGCGKISGGAGGPGYPGVVDHFDERGRPVFVERYDKNGKRIK